MADIIDSSFMALAGLNNSKDGEYLSDKSKLIAFYLPQFHRVKENSEWWGDGFTEWTNVVQGKPNFEGHYQPHIPQHFGFYDLSNVEVLREQAEIAKLYGIYGFCFYHYWFSGRRILEKPVDDFLKTNIDTHFCLCWANENWTRTWDGDNKSILMEQRYATGDDESFIASLIPYFKDERYIRVDNKPMLLVYRAKDLPNPKKSFSLWRKLIKDYGFDGVHICVVDFYDIAHPGEVGADAMVEFPPHKFNGPHNQPSIMPKFINSEFSGGTLEYAKIIAQSISRETPAFKLYRGIIPSWDNTARRQNTPTTVINASPTLYGKWLEYLRAYTRKNHNENSDNFIFINAWNEWGEGCHLEPDLKWGMSYLEETYKSSFYMPDNKILNKSPSLRVEALVDYINSRDEANDLTLGQLASEMHGYKPIGKFVSWIKLRLIGYPLIYRIGKSIYLKFK